MAAGDPAMACRRRGGLADLSWPLNCAARHALPRRSTPAFAWVTDGYTRLVGRLLRVSRDRAGRLRRPAGADRLRVSARRRKGFIPSQDMGYLLVNVQLPDSASIGAHRST